MVKLLKQTLNRCRVRYVADQQDAAIARVEPDRFKGRDAKEAWGWG